MGIIILLNFIKNKVIFLKTEGFVQNEAFYKIPEKMLEIYFTLYFSAYFR
jgi:hypothetical protein